MSTLIEKMDKQFEYQRTLYATSGKLDDMLVDVGYLSAYLAQQMRADLRSVRPRVKAEMERRADAGVVRRWTDVMGPSLRAVRADHYFLLQDQ